MPVLVTYLTCLLLFTFSGMAHATPSIERVAHAGGGYQNWQYTNSLEALEFNRDHFTLFEIDLSWTSDRQLVCLHDWTLTAEWIFQHRFDDPVTLDEFEHLASNHPHAESCTLTTLIEWLSANPDKRLVTDIKYDNLQGLAILAEQMGDNTAEQVIAQIYHPDEYATARELGYRDIIWTLYRFDGNPDSIVEYSRELDLYAITMPRHLAEAGLADRLKTREIATYVHTINTQRELERFRSLGIDEIYTDWLPAN